jgi:hypothetical protein
MLMSPEQFQDFMLGENLSAIKKYSESLNFSEYEDCKEVDVNENTGSIDFKLDMITFILEDILAIISGSLEDKEEKK